jgi:tetratricopeptide (TPR) repeat protein
VNPYEILEVRPGATAEDVKAAYHRLAKQWHPDRFSGDQKIEAEHKFRQLTEAFNMLKSVVPKAADVAPKPAAPAASAPAPATPFATGSIALDTTPMVTSVQDWFNKAKSAFENRQHQEALGYIEYALKLESEKYDYHALHSKILDAIGQDKRALVGALENCLRLNNKDADSAIKLAETYQGIGMYARATRYWEWAANLAPDHPYFVKQKASAKERAQETAEGIGGQFRLWVDQAKDALTKLTKR